MKRILPVFGVSLVIAFCLTVASATAQDFDWHEYIEQRTDELFDQVVEWRRHFHENPELSNREFETARYIERFLRDLGLEVETEIAHTGVVGVLEGGMPGPVVGLRADMDALPVRERVDIPFASNVVSEYMGEEVPVSHACGHDTHMAMLMGAAKILTEKKEELSGTVKFIFQPAEEGAPEGEEGGAELMVREGVLENPDVDVIFGQHIWSLKPVGKIGYRAGGIMAASDRFRITVHGRQTHGSTPWDGVDPVTASAQIITGLNTIVSRQTELTKEAAVISVGRIRAGVRHNIIPETAELIGTIRTLDSDMQDKIHADVHRTATKIAESMGATADVEITRGYPVTYNDPDLTAKMLPSLQRTAGDVNVEHINAITGAEDFSFFQMEVPGLYFFIGGMPPDMDPADAPSHHTPDFYIDEEGMRIGVKALAILAVDYMQMD